MFNVTVEHAILLYQGEAQPSHYTFSYTQGGLEPQSIVSIKYKYFLANEPLPRIELKASLTFYVEHCVKIWGLG